MNPVIKPSLVVGLVGALAGSALLSGVLIVKLGRFDDAKLKADETESRTAAQTTELAKLKTEIESLTRQKDTLQPQIADWQDRLRACLKTRPVRAPGLQPAGLPAQSCRPRALTRRSTRVFKHALKDKAAAEAALVAVEAKQRQGRIQGGVG